MLFRSSYGVSNMSIKESFHVRDLFASHGASCDFAQVHANILEQRILTKYLEVNTFPLLITNRSLARGFLSERYVSGNQLPSSRTLYSERVKKSLKKGHKYMLHELYQLSQKYSISLSSLSYSFLLNKSYITRILPIISPRNPGDLDDYFTALDIEQDTYSSINEALFSIFSRYHEYIENHPVVYLEL